MPSTAPKRDRMAVHKQPTSPVRNNTFTETINFIIPDPETFCNFLGGAATNNTWQR